MVVKEGKIVLREKRAGIIITGILLFISIVILIGSIGGVMGSEMFWPELYASYAGTSNPSGTSTASSPNDVYITQDKVDWKTFYKTYTSDNVVQLRTALQYYNGFLDPVSKAYINKYKYEETKIKNLVEQLKSFQYGSETSMKLLFDNLRGEVQIDALAYMSKNDDTNFQKVLISLKGDTRYKDGNLIALSRDMEIVEKALSGYMFDVHNKESKDFDVPLSMDDRLKRQAQDLAKKILDQYIKDSLEVIGKTPSDSSPSVVGPSVSISEKIRSREHLESLLKYIGDGKNTGDKSTKFESSRENFLKTLGKIDVDNKNKGEVYSNLWKGLTKDGKANLEKILSSSFQSKDADVQKTLNGLVKGYIDIVFSTQGRWADGKLRNSKGEWIKDGEIKLKEISGLEFVKEMKEGKFVLTNGKIVDSAEVPVFANKMVFSGKGTSYHNALGGILNDFETKNIASINHYGLVVINGKETLPIGSSMFERAVSGSEMTLEDGKLTMKNSASVDGFKKNTDGSTGNWDTYFLGSDDKYYVVEHKQQIGTMTFDPKTGKITSTQNLGMIEMSPGLWNSLNSYYSTADSQRGVKLNQGGPKTNFDANILIYSSQMDVSKELLYSTPTDTSKTRAMNPAGITSKPTSDGKSFDITVAGASDVWAITYPVGKGETNLVNSLDVVGGKNVYYQGPITYNGGRTNLKIDGKDVWTSYTGGGGCGSGGCGPTSSLQVNPELASKFNMWSLPVGEGQTEIPRGYIATINADVQQAIGAAQQQGNPGVAAGAKGSSGPIAPKADPSDGPDTLKIPLPGPEVKASDPSGFRSVTPPTIPFKIGEGYCDMQGNCYDASGNLVHPKDSTPSNPIDSVAKDNSGNVQSWTQNGNWASNPAKSFIAQQMTGPPKEGQNVYVMYSASNCGPCNTFKETNTFSQLSSGGNLVVLTQPDYKSYRGSAGIAAKTAGVKSYPTFVKYNSVGQEIGRSVGSFSY